MESSGEGMRVEDPSVCSQIEFSRRAVNNIYMTIKNSIDKTQKMKRTMWHFALMHSPNGDDISKCYCIWFLILV